MSQEELFSRIKKRCDESRILAAGTGRPMVFTISSDDMHYSFTIGAKTQYQREFVFISTGNKQENQKFLLSVMDTMAESKIEPSALDGHFINLVGLDHVSALVPASYDKINIALSGTLAAVYGTHTQLKQLLVADGRGNFPTQPGFRDLERKQLLYPL